MMCTASTLAAGVLLPLRAAQSCLLPALHPAWAVPSSTLSSAAAMSEPRKRGPDSSLSLQQAVDKLCQAGLLTERAAAALQAVDRRHFVQTYAGIPDVVAYQDSALPISCGQTMPSLSVHAKMLSLLESHVQPGAAVLDLGAGTGFMAACLAQLAGHMGSVLALEKHAKLVQRAQASVRASIPGLADRLDIQVCNVMTDPPVLQGSGRFDAIHVGASVQEVPRAFVQLLKPGGRMVLPLGAMHGAAPQVVLTIDKAADGMLRQQQHGSLTTRIQPLTQAQDDNIWSD